MKKWIALLLAAMMLLSLCACGEDEKSISDAANGQTVNEPARTPKGAFSTTMPSQGFRFPAFCNPMRYGSGFGLPRFTS